MYPLESGNIEERERQVGPAASGRREFLRQVGTAPVALAAAGAAYGASAVAETHTLPQIRLGEHSISRLICGDNPFKANSHLSVSLNQHMRPFKKLLDHVPIPVSEVYLTEDPPRMFQAIRNTKRPCLAFKILAAGRCSWHREWVERAFRQTFQSIKPTDAVIVGMYNEFNDEPAENAELVRRYGS